MTYTRFFSEVTGIFSMIGTIVNSIPSIILDIMFTIVAFSVVIAIVRMVREIR